MTRRLPLLLLILLIGLRSQPVTLLAQTEDPFPLSDGFIYDWDAEVIFPAGVYFSVKVYRPIAELQNISLTIQAGNSPPVMVTVEPADGVVLNLHETQYSYIWQAPRDLEIFTDIIYSWQAQAVGDQFASLRNHIIFEDQRVAWQMEEMIPDRVRIITPVDGPTPAQVWEQVGPAYMLLEQNTGEDLPFNFILYTDSLALDPCVRVTLPDGNRDEIVTSPRNEISLSCQEGARSASALYHGAGIKPIESSANTAIGVHDDIVVPMVMDFYNRLWADTNTPTWFKYGLAQFYTHGSKSNLLDPVRNAVRTNRLLTFHQLWGSRQETLERLSQSYAQVLYMAHTIGVDALFELANMRSGTDFPQAYELAMGHPLSSLQTNMSHWIFTNQAASDFLYDPYQPTTSTPTVTYTPSATFTATATVTASPTITPSVTGVHSPTPSLTPRPSETPIPPTATVTPRPAGSLFTPTPVPVSILDDPVGQQGVLAVVFIVLAIVGVASIIIWRRNN
jgi:hypothetical protein